MRSVKMSDDDNWRFIKTGKFPDSAPDTEWLGEGGDVLVAVELLA